MKTIKIEIDDALFAELEERGKKAPRPADASAYALRLIRAALFRLRNEDKKR